jgi:hypothetical protein
MTSGAYGVKEEIPLHPFTVRHRIQASQAFGGGMRRAPLRIKIDTWVVLLEVFDGRGLIQLSLNPSYRFF